MTEHLVCLMWNAPLPVHAMARRLKPRRLTVISPGAGADGEVAEHVVGILRSEGFDVRYRPVTSAVDLDAERESLPSLRKVLDTTLRHRQEVTLDYTGGSKLMSAYARWLLGDAPSRAVYLDARTSDAVFDDGRRVPYEDGNLALDLIAALHRTVLTEFRRVDPHTPLDRDLDRGDALLKRLADLTRGVRAFTTGDVVAFVNAAVDGRPADLQTAIGRFARGTAVLLDLEVNKQGDWLERWLAGRVRETLPDADVYLNVAGRLELPAVTRLLGILGRPPADGDGLAAAAAEAVDSARRASGARFEIDVVSVRGYGVSALSCYAGMDRAAFTWKAREISARAAQVGGSVTRPVFVAPLESQIREELTASLMPGWDKLTGTRVLGLNELLQTVHGDRRPLREALVGRPPQTPAAPHEQDPIPDAIDLVATVGGSPLPTHQAIAVHGARNVLLVHSPDMRAVAERIADVNRTSERSVTLRSVDPFAGHDVTVAVREAGPAAALDVTGGTKPMAAHALLAHAARRDVAPHDVTYVDGLEGVLRHLDGGAQRLPLNLQPSDVLLLHGWRLTSQSKPSRMRGDDAQLLATRVRRDERGIETPVAAALASAMSMHIRGAVVRSNVALCRVDDRTAVADGPPAVVATVNGILCALFSAWAEDDPRRRVWQALALGRQLGGSYTRVAVFSRMSPDKAATCEQATVVRTAGNPQARVLSLDDVARVLEGDAKPLLGWARGGS